MEKLYYKDMNDFLITIKPYKIFPGNEGTIYFSQNFVYKIIEDVRFLPNLRFIKSLNKLDSSLLTIPISLVYFTSVYDKDNKNIESCTGIKMDNGGCDLWSLILNDSLTFTEKKDIAFQMKKICLYLKKKRYIHGDIKLENFLYKDGLLRLTDLNNMKKTPNINRCVDKIRMPLFYDNLYKKCGDGFYLDYLAINFCMYILLNFTSLDVEEISKSISYGFSYNCNKILNSKTKYLIVKYIKE